MTVGEAVVACEAPAESGGQVRWAGSMDYGVDEPAKVRFDFTCPDPAAVAPSMRPFLLAFLPAAMRLGKPIRVAGEVDAVTISNLMEWQEAMASWRPGRLQVVAIRADLEPASSGPPPATRGICSFSGGVDSCFTAVRSAGPASEPGYRSPALSAGLMVHGFDIRLEREDSFRAAFARSERILNALGIAAYRLRSDVRRLAALFGPRWGRETHGIWIAAALACLEGQFTHTVVPATYPFPRLRLPWASNPLTDPLLSSATRPLWHDGAAHDKLAKVRRIAGHDAVTENLRVCFTDPRQDRNCGRCFKCVTTQVCLWLCGVPDPGCFDRRCDPSDVAALALGDPYKRALATRMRDEAERQGRRDVARALARALRRNERSQRARRLLAQPGSWLRRT